MPLALAISPRSSEKKIPVGTPRRAQAASCRQISSSYSNANMVALLFGTGAEKSERPPDFSGGLGVLVAFQLVSWLLPKVAGT
tara:strand:+ start:324 stop:572 length:249 start_codon:yes stop_codon:yes gene_type:complete